jgi:hypothetical protein
VDDTAVIAGYDALLTSVGSRAGAIGDRPVVTHWPHVGSSYRGLVIVGQAVYGWGDDSEPNTSRRRLGGKRASRPFGLGSTGLTRSTGSRDTPFAPRPSGARSVDSSRRSNPTRTLRGTRASPGVNLYPAAPENPPGNPGGALREAQDPHVGPLLRAVTGWLDARRVIAVVGPFWWSAARPAGLADLPEEPRPLLRAGRSGGRTWVVGWHPNGANHRGFGPAAYTEIIVKAVAKVESTRP